MIAATRIGSVGSGTRNVLSSMIAAQSVTASARALAAPHMATLANRKAQHAFAVRWLRVLLIRASPCFDDDRSYGSGRGQHRSQHPQQRFGLLDRRIIVGVVDD